MIVHIDCNNFFASCEMAFMPKYRNKPVIVANDNEAGGGVILALSSEAKKMGFKRGMPIFQVKELIKDKQVFLFHSNISKYKKISKLIMQLVVAQDIVQDIVQYSIDEFFGSIPIDDEIVVRKYIEKVKKEIQQKTDIPVSCGCSQSYTLAKVATWYSKHYKGYNGICILAEKNREKALEGIPISDIWGIGKSHLRFLSENGIRTALDFTKMSEVVVKRAMKIGGQRTWLELHGTPAIVLNNSPKQKSMSQSQTLAFMTDDLLKLKELIADFASNLAYKLREQNSVCKNITVTLHTNRHRLDLPQYSANDTIKLITPTQDTRLIIKTAISILESIYQPNFMYKKIGIILTEISSASNIQLDLFETNDLGKSKKLMQAMDEINKKFGHETLHSALQSTKKHIDKQ